MNDLNDTTTNFLQIKKLLEDYSKNKNQNLLNCIITLLEHYIDIQDQKFKDAWDSTIGQIEKFDDYKMNSFHYEPDYLVPNCSEDTITLSSPNKWIIPVEHDMNGECFITFPKELIDKVGWELDDQIIWSDNGDGTWTLKTLKKATKPLNMDEC